MKTYSRLILTLSFSSVLFQGVCQAAGTAMSSLVCRRHQTFIDGKCVENEPPVCVTSAEDLEKYKDKLPASFQKVPAIFEADGGLVHAGFVLAKDESSSALKVHALVGKPYKTNSDDYLASACVDGNNIKITMQSGASTEMKIKGEGISYMGVTFKKSEKTETEFLNGFNTPSTSVNATSVAGSGGLAQ